MKIRRIITGFSLLPVFVNYKTSLFGKFYLIQEYNEEFNCWIDIDKTTKEIALNIGIEKPYHYRESDFANWLVDDEDILNKLPKSSEHFTDMFLVGMFIFIVAFIFCLIFGI